jgi:hypothetical protein
VYRESVPGAQGMLKEIFRYTAKTQHQNSGGAMDADLSDSTFFALEAKIDELNVTKVCHCIMRPDASPCHCHDYI